jgi:hypothetical protein
MRSRGEERERESERERETDGQTEIRKARSISDYLNMCSIVIL